MDTEDFTKQSILADQFLRQRLRAFSRRLLSEREAQLATRQYNLESGIPLEEFFRSELAELLRPYVVDVGHVVDSQGRSAGECDVVLLEPRLAPLLVAPSTPSSRRKFFAHEATYGVIEVKQSLTIGASDQRGRLIGEPKGTLWEACRKVFSYKQLRRAMPKWQDGATAEPIGIIVCYGTDLDCSTPEAQDRILRDFVAVNATVRPEHRVNALYVLEKFTMNWTKKGAGPEIFDNLQHCSEWGGDLFASMQATGADTMHHFFLQLWDLLTRTRLVPPNLLRDYGGASLKGIDLRSMRFPALVE